MLHAGDLKARENWFQVGYAIGLQESKEKKEVNKMEKLALYFTMERTTKNTVRYQEDSENPKVGTLYVQKSALGSPYPEGLYVIIEAE